MSHEISPKNVYISPHLKGVMRERNVYVSHFHPAGIDEITTKLGVPEITEKKVLLKSWNTEDTFHENLEDVSLTISLSPNTLDPNNPKRLTRTIGRAILMDPKLNPNYRVPNPFKRKDFWNLLELYTLGGALTVGTGIAEKFNYDLSPSNTLYAGIGAGILAATTIRYGFAYMVKPATLDAYDAFRIQKLGKSVRSPLKLTAIDQGSGGVG